MENSLQNKFPEIAKEWDYIKNGDKTPDNVCYGSAKKYWWICKNNHPFEMSVNHRTSRNSSCPYCSNKKVLKDYNDLLFINPKLCEEWNYNKNEIKPDEVTFGSNKKVWWICKNKHEWRTTIYHRMEGTYCPECQKNKKVSFNELSIYYYVKKYFPDAISTFKEKKFELDIYIPSLNTGIEYDSFYFHKNKEKDLHKNKICIDKKMKLYRIREYNCPTLNSSSIDFYVKNNKSEDMDKIILKLIKSLTNKNINKNIVNIKRDNSNILNLYDHKEFLDSLYYKNPNFLKEWNYEKNIKITPKNISIRSNKKIWWKCKENHEWEATPNNRFEGYNCPYCSNQKILKGYNDLETKRPELLPYWDFNKNEIKSYEIAPYSSKPIWWKCKENHSWQKTPNAIKTIPSCPYCSNKKVLKGYNDLLTKKPEINLFWDYNKNDKKPEEYYYLSHKKVFWCCTCEHEWFREIKIQTKYNNCPKCKLTT